MLDLPLSMMESAVLFGLGKSANACTVMLYCTPRVKPLTTAEVSKEELPIVSVLAVDPVV